jgi:acetylglutamate kinase
MQLLKIGGNEMDSPGFLPALAEAVARLREPVLIVHGGGKEITGLQARLGIRPRVVDGLRVTDAESLEVAQMVLSGSANKRVVAALLAAGVAAAGVSGVDGGLLRCRPKRHPAVDLGLVGEVSRVDLTVLSALLKAGITPVVSPISLGEDGQTYNVNADEAAGALAAALGAESLTFISNVPRVLDGDGRLIPRLTAAECEHLIVSGVIHGGMIPKTQAALAALAQGAQSARISDLSRLSAGGGTTFVAG